MNARRFAKAVVLLLINAVAWAQTTSLPLTDDTHIANDAGDWLQADRNYGSRPLMLVHDWGPFYALIRFDAAAISGQTVDSATLRLNLADLRVAGSISVHAITSPWTESSVTWNTGPSFEPAAETIIEIGSADVGSVVSVDITHLVAQWASGALQNHGVLLRTTEPIRAVFDTKETPGGLPAELEVNASTGPSVYAKVLDFGNPAACVLDQSGYYIVNRSWDWYEENLCFAPGTEYQHPVIRVTADDVSIDLNGFEIGSPWLDTTLIEVTGARFEIRNGELVTESYYAGGVPLHVKGGEFLIDNITAATIIAVGDNGLVKNIRTSEGGINLGENGTLQDSLIRCGAVDCIWVESNAVVKSNRIYADAGSAIRFNPFTEEIVQHVLIVDNVITGTDPETVIVRGNNNVIKSNIIETQFIGGGVALVVSGSGNVIESNVILPGHLKGIVFRQNGNYYGNNRVAAITPFDLGGTLQTDWGGNVSF